MRLYEILNDDFAKMFIIITMSIYMIPILAHFIVKQRNMAAASFQKNAQRFLNYPQSKESYLKKLRVYNLGKMALVLLVWVLFVVFVKTH